MSGAVGMGVDRAQRITGAITAAALWAQGILDTAPDLSPLDGVSLSEMLVSQMAIRAANAKAAADAGPGGGYTLTTVCDDRLVAAVYTLLHCKPSSAPIAADATRGVAILPLRIAKAAEQG